MIRSPRMQVEHDDLVRMMVNYFEEQGYTNVKADLDGYDKPETIRGRRVSHIPDLTCNKNDAARTFLIIEAETCDSIDDTHTARQWTLFRSAADNRGGEFHIVVPRMCGDTDGVALASQRLEKLGISADEIWTP